MIRKLILPKILSYSATMFGESRHMPYRSIHFRVCRQISNDIVRVQSINKHLREITVYYGKQKIRYICSDHSITRIIKVD